CDLVRKDRAVSRGDPCKAFKESTGRRGQVHTGRPNPDPGRPFEIVDNCGCELPGEMPTASTGQGNTTLDEDSDCHVQSSCRLSPTRAAAPRRRGDRMIGRRDEPCG